MTTKLTIEEYLQQREDLDYDEEQLKEVIKELRAELVEKDKKILEYEVCEEYMVKKIREGGRYDDILQCYYRQGQVIGWGACGYKWEDQYSEDEEEEEEEEGEEEEED